MNPVPESPFLSLMKKNFGFRAEGAQKAALEALARFVENEEPSEKVFILQGYAGTGKTSLVAALRGALRDSRRKSVLLAPTGRAAKVMAGYAKDRAFTIHKYIYAPVKEADGSVRFALKKNKAKDTVYIVDEASMITDRVGDSPVFVNSSLLDDLLLFAEGGKGCKIVMVGDRAQLPPVGYDESPALEQANYLRRYGSGAEKIVLKDIFRQEEGSTILENASRIRRFIDKAGHLPWGALRFKEGDDFIRLKDGYDIQSAINDSYSNTGEEDTIVITRSNKRANLFNQQIRNRIKLRDGEISAGDVMMVVRNNYYWMDEKTSHCGFIANGDMIQVLKIYKWEELYGLRFVHVTAQLIDYPDDGPFETILLVDTIYEEAPSLSPARGKLFFAEVMKDFADEPYPIALEKVRKSPHFNALQVKFGYAVTCHKAQGGQWKDVYIEQVWMPEKKLSVEYLRWLYTAVTRAQERVFLLGFEDEFFEKA